MVISENIRNLQPSATLGVSSLCQQMRVEGRSVLDLSVGEPDFRTPEFASQAGSAAIAQGFTQYTPVPGTRELRAAIATYLGRVAGRPIDAAGVVVSAGAKQALFNVCFSLFGPGDEVIVPAPYWTSYPEIIALARARPVYAAGDPGNALKVDPAALAGVVTPATRGLIINSPGNPTGAVYARHELDAILLWAAERGLWVISDEIYNRLCYDGQRATSVLELDPSLLGRVVVVDGVSKSFAMTGWRVGFSWSSAELAGHFAALQGHVTSGASSPAQAAALAAYRDEPRVQESVHAMVRVFQRRRNHAVAALREVLPQAVFDTPGGAFYIFFRVDAYYDDTRPGSVEFCRDLLEHAGVALVPGVAFGDDRFVRLSFAAPEGEILEGIRRIGQRLHGQPVDAATAGAAGAR
jgi:aspartate/methionine/tyrosine aminotransferase